MQRVMPYKQELLNTQKVNGQGHRRGGGRRFANVQVEVPPYGWINRERHTRCEGGKEEFEAWKLC